MDSRNGDITMKKGIITYDISNTRRRNKIAVILSSYCKRIQYSVFEFELNENIFESLLDEIAFIFNNNKNITKDNNKPNVFSIRIYLLCDSCLKKMYIFENKKYNYLFEGNIF